jgi:hypothetical protein
MADKLSPGRQQINYVRARIKLARGDNAGGLAEMQKAIDIDPTIGEPHFYHALISIGTASIDQINREFVLALDLGFQPRTSQELRLLYNYFIINEQYALGIDYFAELQPTPTLRLDQQLYAGSLAYHAGQYANARLIFENIRKEYPAFFMTERFVKEFKSQFKAVGMIE